MVKILEPRRWKKDKVREKVPEGQKTWQQRNCTAIKMWHNGLKFGNNVPRQIFCNNVLKYEKNKNKVPN